MAVLIVRRTPLERGTVRHTYELRDLDATVRPLQQEFTAEIDEEVVRELCLGIEEVAERSTERGAPRTGATDELRELGRLLHDILFPPVDGNPIPGLVARLRGIDGSLLVSTDEPRVPWELLHDGEEFLGLRHDLGRQLVVDGRTWVKSASIPAIERALLVGDPVGDLPMAAGEVERVASWLERQGAECTVLLGDQAKRDAVLRELASGRYQLFHYAGHVLTPPAPSGRPADGWAALALHDLAALRAGTIGAALARHDSPPVVFVNGCASGEPLSSLCAEFLRAGAAVVLGTLHRISEEAAAGFAEHLYSRLLAGVPAGRAVREARLELNRMGELGWMSFVFHGDPEATIRVGGTRSASSPTRQPDRDELFPGLPVQPDERARALLERVAHRAAGRGIATSLELLAELLAPGGPLRQVAEQREVAGVDDAERVLQVLLGLTEGAEATDQVSLSDTVVRVLSQAAERAVRDGGRQLTVVDLADAFVELGGGTSARVLESCGVDLRDLRRVAEDRPTGEAARWALPRGEPLDERLAPAALLALQVASLLRSGEGTVVSSFGLLYGFGLTGSRVLRACLEEQGPAGREAVRRLFPVPHGLGGHFSRRVRQALDRAGRAKKQTGAPQVGEAAVLEALLADEEATACRFLEGLGVDVARLREALRRSHGAGGRPDVAS
jgi:CHAT domain/Clp amino terminal domain, pathogenicity island component